MTRLAQALAFAAMAYSAAAPAAAMRRCPVR